MSTHFTVSIITFTALEEVRKCIESVLASGDDCDLILTANGNPLAAQYFRDCEKALPGRVRVVVNARNEGFILPSNRALAMTETPYFVMLNDDTVVPEHWLKSLSFPFTKYSRAALTGPSGTCRSLRPNLDGYKGPRLEYIEGSCLMAKTELLKKHGLFPDWLQFAYGEDVELSLRMRSLGYTIHQAPFSIIHHGRTTSRHIPGVWEMRQKNHDEIRKRYGKYLASGQFR